MPIPKPLTQTGALFMFLITKTIRAMRDFFERLMTDDESGQKFTTKEVVVYGIVVPVVLVLIMGIAGWMETCCA